MFKILPCVLYHYESYLIYHYSKNAALWDCFILSPPPPPHTPLSFLHHVAFSISLALGHFQSCITFHPPADYGDCPADWKDFLPLTQRCFEVSKQWLSLLFPYIVGFYKLVMKVCGSTRGLWVSIFEQKEAWIRSGFLRSI